MLSSDANYVLLRESKTRSSFCGGEDGGEEAEEK